MSKLFILSFLALAVAMTSAIEMVKQCTCDEIQPCKKKYEANLVTCADKCKQHATAIGANYDKLRTCLTDREAQIKKGLECVEDTLKDSCTAKSGPKTPKRFPESTKLTAWAEINKMLQRSGVQAEVKPLIGQAKKFAECVEGCLMNHAGECEKKLGCGLKLPSDATLVDNTKKCAIQNGFNTEGVQKVCHCAVDAGVKQLANVCDRLKVT